VLPPQRVPPPQRVLPPQRVEPEMPARTFVLIRIICSLLLRDIHRMTPSASMLIEFLNPFGLIISHY
jgi:hypothetical protein